jgi:cytochrome P450
MIEASGEEGDSDETEPPAECPAHRTTTKTGAEGVHVMTDNEVAENAMLFLLAGKDTTASLMSSCSYQLALHPDIQERLQSDIDTYFEEKPVSLALIIKN